MEGKNEVKVFDALKARKVLERVHNYLGILIRENLVKDAPFLSHNRVARAVRAEKKIKKGE